MTRIYTQSTNDKCKLSEYLLNLQEKQDNLKTPKEKKIEEIVFDKTPFKTKI